MYRAWFFTKIRGVRVEEYAYYVNNLSQNIGLETWIWCQIVTSQKEPTPNTNDHHMSLNETPPWKFSAYATVYKKLVLFMSFAQSLWNHWGWMLDKVTYTRCVSNRAFPFSVTTFFFSFPTPRLSPPHVLIVLSGSLATIWKSRRCSALLWWRRTTWHRETIA